MLRTNIRSLFRLETVAMVAALLMAGGVWGCASPSKAAPSSAELQPTHSQNLVAVQGSGAGLVDVIPTTGTEGLAAQIDVNMEGAPPSTTFYVQRAPELGRALGDDGICQRALQLDPWLTPPAPAFVTVPLPGPGPLVTLTTSPEGSGKVHIDFAAPGIADGTRFDIMFRLVDDPDNPTNELRSACFTVTAK